MYLHCLQNCIRLITKCDWNACVKKKKQQIITALDTMLDCEYKNIDRFT